MEGKYYIYAEAADECTYEVNCLCHYLNNDGAKVFSRTVADFCMATIVNWFVGTHEGYNVLFFENHKMRLMRDGVLQATIYTI